MSMRSIAALLAIAAACGHPATTPAPGDHEALVALQTRVDKLEKKLHQVAEAAGALEPDPAVVYSMPVDGYPSEGPDTAKVTLVEGFDFACPYCYRVRPTLAKLRERYGDDLRVVYKALIIHEAAVAPALASCAAHRQGKFLAMKDLIWDEGFAKAAQGEEFDDSLLDPDHMKALAEKAGLDMAQFDADVTSPDCISWLRGSGAAFNQLSVHATPAFFINGRFLSGARPLDDFVQIIDEEKARADKVLAGAPAGDYYKKHVVEAGATEVE